MNNYLKTILLTIIVSSATACGDDKGHDYSKSKQLQPASATVYHSSFPPSAADLEIVQAAKEGNTRRVAALLSDKKAFVTSTDAEGNTALMTASASGYDEIVDTILDYVDDKNRAVLDKGNQNGITALHMAAETGTAKTIELLREAGANPNIYDSNKRFPLYLASERNRVEIVKALLDIDSDYLPTNPDIQNADGMSAVHAASLGRNFEILKLLAEYQADFNISDIKGYTPAIYAIKNGDMELLDFLLANGSDVNNISSSEKTALSFSIENERYTFTRHLLDKGADPNIHSEGLSSPLQLLVNRENANPETVQYMISKGAKIKDEKMPLGSVISRAVHKGNAPAIKVLLENGADVKDLETGSSNGIFEAIKAGDEDIAILMIENGADLNKLDESGFSALALAAKNKLNNLFKTLIEKGADVNQTSQNSAAIPLDIIIANEDPELLDLMFGSGLKSSPDSVLLRVVTDGKFKLIPIALKHGARPDIMNTLDQPILWLAASKGDLDAVTQLVEAGASLEVKDGEKKLTPLAVSTIKKSLEIANYLLEKGANPNNGDANGITPTAYAALTGQGELLKAMMAKGGNVNVTDNSGRTLLKLLDSSRIDNIQREAIRQQLTAAGAQ